MHSLITFRTVGIAGLLTTALLGACTASGGDEGIIITKNVAVAGTACTFTGDPNEAFLPHGFLAPEATSYELHPQFESRITDDVTDPTSQAQRTVLVTDANIDITFPGSTQFDGLPKELVHFKELFSVPILPLGTSDGAIQVIHKELIDMVVAAQTAADYDVEIQVTLSANGKMSGGDVTSNTYTYPVTLTTSLVQNLGPCPPPVGSTILLGNACNKFQDDQISCCVQADQTLQCPALSGQ